MELSFKCQLYGDMAHTPCAGTTDDGTASPCECWCHGKAEIKDLPEIEIDT